MTPHAYHLRVYYEDTDAGGVVYHANYLKFAERARTEALRDAGHPHADMTATHGLFFMVRRAKLDYLAPARLDDQLTVTTRVLYLRGASVALSQVISRDGTHLAEAEILLACVRAQDARPARIPERWRQALGENVMTEQES
jgi:acyl-CoA thioester hydrolase